MNNHKSEAFTIESEVVYTIKSKHGTIEIKGYEKLKEHGENLLGAFVDNLHSRHTGNYLKDKQKTFNFLNENRRYLETIFALQDAIFNLEPRPDAELCDGEVSHVMAQHMPFLNLENCTDYI